MKIKQLRIFYYKPIILQKNQPLPTFMVEKKIFIILLTSDGIEGYGVFIYFIAATVTVVVI